LWYGFTNISLDLSLLGTTSCKRAWARNSKHRTKCKLPQSQHVDKISVIFGH